MEASSPPVSELTSLPPDAPTDAPYSDGPAPEEKPRYKSYRKKYKKMQIKFQELLNKSKELHRESLKAKRILDRIYRENTQVAETLVELNESEMYPSKHKVFPDNGGSAADTHAQIPLEAQQYLSLLDHAVEFSSDEENAPVNPMLASEWLKRNRVVDALDPSAAKRKISDTGTDGPVTKRLKEDGATAS